MTGEWHAKPRRHENSVRQILIWGLKWAWCQNLLSIFTILFPFLQTKVKWSMFSFKWQIYSISIFKKHSNCNTITIAQHKWHATLSWKIKMLKPASSEPTIVCQNVTLKMDIVFLFLYHSWRLAELTVQLGLSGS